MNCTIFIDGREVKTTAGSNLLWTALDNGIYIPNLCCIKGIERQPASCRLCFVEIEGMSEPVAACAEPVIEGMMVNTAGPTAKTLRRTSFELLMSNHLLECARCHKNRHCELQRIARSDHLRLKTPSFARINFNFPLDDSHPLFTFNPNKCVLCGRCIWICSKVGKGVLDFAHRGISTRVSTFMGLPIAESSCDSCLACVDICPVGALYKKLAEIKI